MHPFCGTAAVYAKGKGAHGIHVTQGPRFVPGSTKVILKVLAAGINPVDYKIPEIKGYRGGAGLDVCGEVVHAPLGSSLKIGDIVFGFTQSGSLAEYCECEPGKVALKPEQLSAVQCAMLPVAGLTALQALRDHGQVKAGESVLVIGGSGGCGALGVSIGKAMGAQITAVCSQKNAEFVKALGADWVHCYDGADGQLPLSRKGEFDCIFDTVTSPDDFNYEPTARVLLKAKRMYVAINGMVADWIRLLLGQALCLGNGLQRSGYRLFTCQQKSSDLSALADLCTSAKLPLTLDDFSLTEKPLFTTQTHIDAAFTRLKSRRTKGKIVLAAAAQVWEDHLKLCS